MKGPAPVRGRVERFRPCVGADGPYGYLVMLQGEGHVYRILDAFPKIDYPVSDTRSGDEVSFVVGGAGVGTTRDFRNLSLEARCPEVTPQPAPAADTASA